MQMKKMMLKMAAIIFMAGMIGVSAMTAQAKESKTFSPFFMGEQDFTLVNSTGVEIHALYVTPHSANDWGEDVLGVDTLAASDDVTIHFSWKEKAKFWDLRVEDQDGNYIEWDKLNLIEISTVTLYYKNGKATAVVE
jgi:hypothetical protein